MKEQLLQFIWQFQYFNNKALVTEAGETLQILHQGIKNNNQGADFLQASIKINNITLVGNIEIHINSSHWILHKHTHDNNFKNIILHVVWQNDKQIFDTNKIALPTLVLKNIVPKTLLVRYQDLMNESPTLPCKNYLPLLTNLGWAAWKESLVIERFINKSNLILELFKKNNNNWEETFWQILAYNFGLKVNADIFIQIAQKTPINILSKNKNNIQSLEALLLGQSNLLNNDFSCEYAIKLQKEFQYLKKKYALKQVIGTVKFLRMRPANFPTIRLAQLAMLICNSSHLFSKLKEIDTIKNIKQLFETSCSDYWNNHFTLTDSSKDFENKKIGNQMVENIVINTIIPTLFAYGNYLNEEDYKLKAINWLHELKPEKNKITNQWVLYKIENKNAFDSQALLQLTKNYCIQKKCLQCAVGNKILTVKN